MFGALIIGDELLSGKREDRHLARVIEALRERGLALSWAQFVGDDRDRITAALARTFASTDIVFVFGGIGATPDDHTRQCAAAALGRALVRHPEALREIEARFGQAAYPHRVAMAEFPEGAAIIPNPYNRIAGFSVARHHFLPGFPEMAWPMLDWVLDTGYRHLHRGTPDLECAFVIRGAGEGDLVELMEKLLRDFPGIKVASLPKLSPGERIVELSVRGEPDSARRAGAFLRDSIAAMGYGCTAL